MNTPSPLVSICVPVYNGESFLEEALRSVLAQTYSNWELIIVEDCSQDCTREVIQSFVDRVADPRIRVHFNESNLGLAGNQSHSIRLARGEFIKVLCADDTLEPECLAVQVRALQQHPSAVIAACSKRIIGAQGKLLFFMKPFRWDGLIRGVDAIKACLRGAANKIGEPTMILIRASALEGEPLLDNTVLYYCDLDLWLRLLLRGDMVFCRQPLASFRVQGQSCTGTNEERMSRDYYNVAERISKKTGIPITPLLRLGMRIQLPLRNALRGLIYRLHGSV